MWVCLKNHTALRYWYTFSIFHRVLHGFVRFDAAEFWTNDPLPLQASIHSNFAQWKWSPVWISWEHFAFCLKKSNSWKSECWTGFSKNSSKRIRGYFSGTKKTIKKWNPSTCEVKRCCLFKFRLSAQNKIRLNLLDGRSFYCLWTIGCRPIFPRLFQWKWSSIIIFF